MNFDFLQDIRWEEIPIYMYAIFGAFTLCTIVQLCFYFGPFRRVARFKPKATANHKQPISIIICSKNEHGNLAKNLPLFLGQQYPQFEVVVVNDRSTDESEALLYALKQQHANLQFTSIDFNSRFMHDKKLAITVGIKAAKYDSVIFVEPYCTPSSSKWLEAMQQSCTDKCEFIIGYCRSEHRKGLGEKIMRSENITSALFALYAAIVGKPYRCSMSNMGMSRELFFRSKGFSSYNAYPHSEETIFLCRNANEQNTRVTLAPDSILTSSLKLTFKQWFKQRREYAALLSMGKRGKKRIRTEMLSRTFYYITAITLLVFAIAWNDYLLLLCIAPLILARLITRLIIVRKILRKFQEQGIYGKFLIYDFFAPILAFIVTLCRPDLQKIKKIK